MAVAKKDAALRKSINQGGRDTSKKLHEKATDQSHGAFVASDAGSRNAVRKN